MVETIELHRTPSVGRNFLGRLRNKLLLATLELLEAGCQGLGVVPLDCELDHCPAMVGDPCSLPGRNVADSLQCPRERLGAFMLLCRCQCSSINTATKCEYTAIHVTALPQWKTRAPMQSFVAGAPMEQMAIDIDQVKGGVYR